jgi:UPF0716 protein FxsA
MSEEISALPLKWGVALVVYPLLEIFIFLAAADYIGVVYAVGWTVLTVLLGIVGIKQNAFKKMSIDSQWRFFLVRDTPSYDPEFYSWVLTKLAYILIIAPGFITDAAGFALLITPLRNRISKMAVANLIKRMQREANEKSGN